ncbi:MAG TPA: glycogen/starch synthase [Chitinophagales bacterium]|jgi:starch synthase|nr:glycogen/starch synthase [Chitinophagales bacterium]MBP6155055.1 glycogen/starch synthase [Chitinophagales bacterium]HQV77629.1 glycogen/starch synthase [Chitinophagales bacterium]HQW78102.1 glycogen/starch synthase [Chitinophagales bacterium]HRB93119.1 glycogen/starch synthase [Chitinophagales bacterium]
MEKKRLLYVTQEMDPYLVLTEAGNIVKKLAPYINDNGLEVRVLMPRFGIINERRNRLHEVVRLSGINIIINNDDYPLIIKVASLPGARIQVYFLDNEEFFKRKTVFNDDDEKFFDDNAERMVFFCKATLETVKKFGWHPNIIHCHGWMTSLIPVYLKTQYAKDPVFANTKTVYSVYEKSFTEKMHKNFLKLALIGDEVKEKDLASFKELTHEALVLGGVQFADAIIQGSENIKEMDVLKKAIGKKPFLPYQEQENILPKYVEFYQSLI